MNLVNLKAIRRHITKAERKRNHMHGYKLGLKYKDTDKMHDVDACAVCELGLFISKSTMVEFNCDNDSCTDIHTAPVGPGCIKKLRKLGLI